MMHPIEPAPAIRKRGNPVGNPGLNLSPRCGARTRSGCPCRGPAVHGGLRCRMHGGRSTGPRTAAGLARSRSARLTHGGYSAEGRAGMRYQTMLMQRTRVFLDVVQWMDRLPEALAARVLEAPELGWPARFVGGLSVREDQAVQRREAAALLPWKEAVRAAKCGKVDEAHTPVERHDALPLSPAREGRGDAVEIVEDEPHTPVFARAADSSPRKGMNEPHAPVLGPPPGLTRKERKRWKWEQRKARKVAVGRLVPPAMGIASSLRSSQ